MQIPLKQKYRVYAEVTGSGVGKKNCECYGTSSDNQRKAGKLKRRKVTNQKVKDAILASQPKVVMTVSGTGKRSFTKEYPQ